MPSCHKNTCVEDGPWLPMTEAQGRFNTTALLACSCESMEAKTTHLVQALPADRDGVPAFLPWYLNGTKHDSSSC